MLERSAPDMDMQCSPIAQKPIRRSGARLEVPLSVPGDGPCYESGLGEGARRSYRGRLSVGDGLLP